MHTHIFIHTKWIVFAVVKFVIYYKRVAR